MKLSEYLADYVGQKLYEKRFMFTPDDLQKFIQQGIEAFVSTENKQVEVHNTVDNEIEERYL